MGSELTNLKFNHYAIEAEVCPRPMCKYDLGVSHFKGTP